MEKESVKWGKDPCKYCAGERCTVVVIKELSRLVRVKNTSYNERGDILWKR